MQASDIIRQFVKLSGRLDLVKQDRVTDNGALFFINAGQHLLDLLQDNPQTEAWHYTGLLTGDSIIEIPSFRSIVEDSVYLVNGSNRIPLTRKTRKWIRDNYSEVSSSQVACIVLEKLMNKAYTVVQPSVTSRLVFEIQDYTTSITAGLITIIGLDENSNHQTEILQCANGAGLYRSTYQWSSITSITTSTFVSLGGAGNETIKAYYPGQSGASSILNAYSDVFPAGTTYPTYYYSPIPINVSPTMQGATARGRLNQYDWGHLHIEGGKFQNAEEYGGLLIAPPLNGTYTFEGLFRFFTPPLVNGTDATIWTTTHNAPVLLHASLGMLESFHRNTEGFNDSLKTINLLLSGMDADMIEMSHFGNQTSSGWVS